MNSDIYILSTNVRALRDFSMQLRIVILYIGKVDVPVPSQLLAAGDTVRIELDVSILKLMQEDHGGWNDAMASVCLIELFLPVANYPKLGSGSSRYGELYTFGWGP